MSNPTPQLTPDLDALLAQVAAGDPSAETTATLLSQFDAQANQLLTADPHALMALVAKMRSVGSISAEIDTAVTFFEAVALRRTEQYQAALTRFDRLLADPDLPDDWRARVVNSRANCLLLLGQPEVALAGYRESLALWQRLGNVRRQGLARLNMGVIAYEMRHYDEARRHLGRAAALFEAADDATWRAVVDNELGLVHRDLGEWEAALTKFEAFVAHGRASGATENVGLGLLNLGEVHTFMGQFGQAKVLLEEARTTLPARTYAIDIDIHLGLIAQAEADWISAEAAYRRAYEAAREIERRDAIPTAAWRLGEVRRLQGDLLGARKLFEEAVAAIETTRAPMQDERLKMSLLGRWQQVYEALVLLNWELGDTPTAFAWAERARARAFSEALGDSAETDPIALSAIQAALPSDTRMLAFFTTGVLDEEMPFLRQLPSSNPLRAHLLTPARTLLFAISAEGVATLDLALDPNLLASQSQRGHDVARFLGEGVRRHLYRLLLEKGLSAETASDRSLNHLLLMPHGPLHHIPFGTLLNATGQPLISAEGPTMSIVPSAAIWLEQQALPTGRGSGAVTVGASGTRNLAYASAEAAWVANRLGGRQLAADLAEDELAQALASPRVVHLACHGWFDEAQPLASYLELGQAGRISAETVLRHWHLAADLVVLSACETGVSRILRGDEPLGLVRACLVAGAKAVVVAQWPVGDLAAFLLMARFYEEMTAGATTAEALRSAQVWLRDATSAEMVAFARDHELAIEESAVEEGSRPFADPLHWGGFVLVGSGT